MRLGDAELEGETSMLDARPARRTRACGFAFRVSIHPCLRFRVPGQHSGFQIPGCRILGVGFTAVVPGDEDVVRLALGHACRDRAHAHLV